LKKSSSISTEYTRQTLYKKASFPPLRFMFLTYGYYIEKHIDIRRFIWNIYKPYKLMKIYICLSVRRKHIYTTSIYMDTYINIKFAYVIASFILPVCRIFFLAYPMPTVKLDSVFMDRQGIWIGKKSIMYYINVKNILKDIRDIYYIDSHKKEYNFLLLRLPRHHQDTTVLPAWSALQDVICCLLRSIWLHPPTCLTNRFKVNVCLSFS